MRPFESGIGDFVIVSANELSFSKEVASAFFLYRLFQYSSRPHVFMLQGDLEETLSLVPIDFRARLHALTQKFGETEECGVVRRLSYVMGRSDPGFELPKSIDRHLAVLLKIYGQNGERQLQELIVNAQTRVHEEWSFDNWNGGTYGHALYLVIPETLFLDNLSHKLDVQQRIKEDLNKLHNIQNESFAEVFLEVEFGEENDWRKKSGLLLAGNRAVAEDVTKRIWGKAGFRVFLSHKSEARQKTATLKDELAVFGISGFVAHKDISPTKAWQDEIESALETMDGFVALMTPKFHDSDWTDQELGFAFARAVPIIAVQLGTTPYGFIGKFQGLATTWAKAAVDIARIFIKRDRMVAAYIGALRQCPNWDSGNKLAEILPDIETMSEQQLDEIVTAYNMTDELRGSFAFNGSNPRYYGAGLVPHLNRLGVRQFRYGASRLIERTS